MGFRTVASRCTPQNSGLGGCFPSSQSSAQADSAAAIRSSDADAYLPLTFTFPIRGWHRSDLRWWLYGVVAYPLLRLSDRSASLAAPDNPPTLSSADDRAADGQTRPSRGAPGNFHRVTVGSTCSASCDQLGLPDVLPPRPECLPPHTRFLFVGPRLCLRLPPHAPLLVRSCLSLANLRAGLPG